MNKVAKFEKVSYDQFKKDWLGEFKDKYSDDLDLKELDTIIRRIYDSIKLPERSTKHSAGYDFHCPAFTYLGAGRAIKIPTGIKCKIDEGWVLQCYPRSSYGFKYGVRLANTVGIIDGDYYNNINNEGHILIKLANDSVLGGNIKIEAGDAFCQGIFLPYGVTCDDNAEAERVGGIGSTGK